MGISTIKILPPIRLPESSARTAVVDGMPMSRSITGSWGKRNRRKRTIGPVKVRKQYGENAGEILKLFPGNTGDQVRESARDLASARFIAYSTGSGWTCNWRRKFPGAIVINSSQLCRWASSYGAYHSADNEYASKCLIEATALDSKRPAFPDHIVILDEFPYPGTQLGLPERAQPTAALQSRTRMDVVVELSLPKAAPDTTIQIPITRPNSGEDRVAKALSDGGVADAGSLFARREATRKR